MAAIGMMVLSSGCNESFSPNGPYWQSLIVYSLMNVSVDTQYVKVYSTYDPAMHALSDQLPVNEVLGASVTLKRDTTLFIFHDTVMNVLEKGALRSQHLYVHYGVNIVPNGTYELTVEQSDYPTARVSCTAMAEGYISPLNTQVISNYSNTKDIELEFSAGKGAYAFLVRLLVEYDKRVAGSWQREVMEVPLGLSGDDQVLPGVEVVDPSRVITKTYKNAVYKEVITRIRSHPADTVRFSGVVIDYQQFDENIFTYYSIANNFPGGSSIRLDEPDFTNVSNGYGVVGMMSRKTQRFTLPPNP